MSLTNHRSDSQSNIHLDPSFQKSCRICYQQQSPGHFISPCICYGSMKYTHKHCLKQWIIKQSSLQKDLHNYIKPISCEVCSTYYHFETDVRRRCAREVCRGISEKSGVLATFILIGVLALAGLGIVLWVGGKMLEGVGYWVILVAMGVVFVGAMVGFFVCLCTERYEDITELYDYVGVEEVVETGEEVVQEGEGEGKRQEEIRAE